MMAAKKANDMAPPRVRREFFRRIEAPYKLTGINAGEVEAVHERTLENLHRQQLVEVEGQSDVAGVRAAVPGPVQRELDPEPDPGALPGARVPVQHVPEQAARPQGGVVIMFHPVPWEFHQIHHPSYIDFFEEVLARDHRSQGRSSRSSRSGTRPTRGTRHLYRTSHAYHGVHPFYMWYWGAHGRDHAAT